MDKEVTTQKGTFKPGELCFAYYWNNLTMNNEVELYYCKIESIQPNAGYCTGTLYHGEEWTGKNQKRGRFTDICINDLVKL